MTNTIMPWAKKMFIQMFCSYFYVVFIWDEYLYGILIFSAYAAYIIKLFRKYTDMQDGYKIGCFRIHLKYSQFLFYPK